jgi:hypothetical protein
LGIILPGKWYIDSINGELKDGNSGEGIEGWPIFEDFPINADITLIPEFTK